MASTATSATRNPRSVHLGLRATPEQERVLRRAAEVAHKSLTDFVLDSACQAAEQILPDQRLFLVSGDQHQTMLELLERPAQDNPGLRDLFSRPEPWETPWVWGPRSPWTQVPVLTPSTAASLHSICGLFDTPARLRPVARPRPSWFPTKVALRGTRA